MKKCMKKWCMSAMALFVALGSQSCLDDDDNDYYYMSVPNAIVTVVALYDRPQVLPLPDMYGKNLTFKTGGVDGCDCAEILRLIADGQIDTTPLITHRFLLRDIEEAYRVFENRLDGVVKVAVDCSAGR